MSKPKPIEPMDNTKMAIIRAAMLLRPLRVRGVNLSAREVLSLIERLRQAENWPTEWPPETF